MQYKQLKRELKTVYNKKALEKDARTITLYQNELRSFYECSGSELGVSVLVKRYKVLLNKQRWSGTNAMGLMVGLWSSAIFFGIDKIMEMVDPQTKVLWVEVIVALILLVPFTIITWTAFIVVSHRFGYALLGNRDIFVETLELELIEKKLQEEGIFLPNRDEPSMQSNPKVFVSKKRCESGKQILRKHR